MLERLHPRTQLDLSGSGTAVLAVLAVKPQIAFSDFIGIKPAVVAVILPFDPVLCADATIDQKMPNIDVLRM